MRLLPPLLLLLAGCSSHLKVPGPLRGLGRAPVVASARIEERTPQAPPATPSPAPTPRPRDDQGRKIADAARHYLNHRLDGFRDDCSGFVCAASTRAGRPLTGNTASLWAVLDEEGQTHRRKRPDIGDLAFFDNTYDRNRDGRVNDELTHVAIVLDVDDDGTILLAHGGTSAGRSELRMNLLHPSDHRADDGTVRNDYLRRRRSNDRAGTPHLAGEMWRGFATLP